MTFVFAQTELQLIRVEVFWLSLVGVWLIYSLLAFWLSKRGWHWFISFGLIAVAVLPLRIIGAGDLMLMQLANSLTVFFAFTGWKRLMKLKEDRQKFPGGDKSDFLNGLKSKLSLASLMLLVAAAAILFSMLNVDLTNLEPRWYSVGFGFAVGLVFMIGFAVASVRRRWSFPLAVPLCAYGIYCAYYWIFPVRTKSGLFQAMFGTSFIWSELELFVRAVLVAIAISGWTMGLIYSMKQQAKGMKLLVSRIGFVLVGIFVCSMAVAFIDVGIKISHQYVDPEKSQRELPVEMKQILDRFAAGQVFDSYPPPDEDTVRAEITKYRDDFFRLREILDRGEVGPTRKTEMEDSDFPENQHVRTVARALSAKARIAFANGDFDQSLMDSLLIVRMTKPLSDKMSLVADLVSLAVEGIGHFAAAESIGSASRSATDDALQQLLKHADNDPEQIYRIDKEVNWNRMVWWGRLNFLCEESKSREMFDQHIMDAIRRVQATRQQTIAMLALELYRYDYGNYPENLESLVPGYLVSVPHDPFQSDEEKLPLKYKQLDKGREYLLYSIGLDRNDDEGSVSEFGYGTPGEDGEDLNFKESARLDLIERDEELKEAAEAAAAAVE